MPTRYAALLRGINVGGKNKLPMKDLAAMFAKAGCKDVETYIQSGNVVFTASAALVKEVPVAISGAIHKKFGYLIPIVLRSGPELARVIEGNPFLGKAETERLHVAFLTDTPSAERVAKLDPKRSPGDELAVRGANLYLHLPNGAGKSKLTNAYLDSTLATTSTVRNWNTVLTLGQLTSSRAASR